LIFPGLPSAWYAKACSLVITRGPFQA
jgi:hypothetical protein